MAGETRQKVYEYLIEYIGEYIKEYCYTPFVREVCDEVGLKSTSSVYEHLSKLKEEGKIEMRGNSPRAIKIVGDEFAKKK